MHYNIQGNAGDLVKVKLDGAAFVRLLDPLSYSCYLIGKPYKSTGGWYETPLVEFAIPYKGTFHLVIDLAGQEGVVKAVVDIIRRGK